MVRSEKPSEIKQLEFFDLAGSDHEGSATANCSRKSEFVFKRPCEECGEPFEAVAGSLGRPRKFCTACAKIVKLRQNREAYRRRFLDGH
jgi:formylmethanofuran dehydrogenase subunit E